LGQYLGSNNSANVASGTFMLNGGVVNVQNLILAESISNNPGKSFGNFILSNGLLQVQTISRGANIGNGSGLVTWVAGTISNYDASTDLTMSGASMYMNLVPGNDHVLGVGDGRTATVGIVITNSGNLVKAGNGLLVLAGSNAYSGDTIISAGTLQLNSALAAQRSTISNLVGAGALQFGSATNAYTVGGLTDAHDIVLTNMSGNGITLSLGNNGSSLVYTHVFSDAGQTGALNKVGSGALTLMSSNTYSGGSTVTGGRLLIGNADALGTGLITLSGGQLASDGSTPRVFTNAVSITTASGLGDAVNTGLLTLSGTVDFNGGGREITNSSDVVISGLSGNGGLTTKSGAGTLTILGGIHDWTRGGAIKVGDGVLVFDGSTVTNQDAFRIGAETANAIARLVVTNGAVLICTNRSANLRIGYGGSSAATNILDVAAQITLNASLSAGEL